MKKILVLAILISSISVKAQTYFVSQIPYNPMPFDSGIEVLNYVDDQYSMPMSIGFDFYFLVPIVISLLIWLVQAVIVNGIYQHQFHQIPIR